jgi:hypothetical protein
MGRRSKKPSMQAAARVQELAASFPPTEAQPVVVDLAGLVLRSVAPEELLLLPETAAEFFADPRATLTAQDRDEPLGFGIDVALLTPAVLAVASAAVQALWDMVSSGVAEAVRPNLTDRIRLLLRIRPEPVTVSLTPAQAAQVHDVARRQALAVGLDDSRALMLADAVIGSLVVARQPEPTAAPSDGERLP